MENITLEFAAQQNQDLATRALQGAWGHAAALVLIVASTRIAIEHPQPYLAISAAFLVLTCVRLLLIFKRRSIQPAQWPYWRAAIFASVYATVLVWGALFAYSSHVYGYDNRNSTVVLVYITAIAGAGVQLFEQEFRLAIAYIVVAMSPIVTVSLIAGPSAGWLTISIAFYTFYLTGNARRSSRDYWQRLNDNLHLKMVSRHDVLTGLANRLAIREHLEEAIRAVRQKSARLALLYIDLNGFKSINDSLSHHVGDIYLTEIANRIAAAVGNLGMVGRLGGDEFAVVLSDKHAHDRAAWAADRILAHLAKDVMIEGHRLAASASIGIGLYPDDAGDIETLFRAADQAMYEAKLSRRSAYQFFGAPDQVFGAPDQVFGTPDQAGPSLAVSTCTLSA